MGTQDSGFGAIHFSISSPFQSVRLMEIPDDLADAIEKSKKKGQNANLKFKSTPSTSELSTARMTTTTTTTTRSQNNDSGILHLCTQDKAWAVRQVSTSNSVYLVQPSNSTKPPKHDDEDVMMEVDDHAELESAVGANVSAVAQVGHFLELQPVKTTESEIEVKVLQLLPTFKPVSLANNEAILPEIDTKQSRSLSQLFDDITVSDLSIGEVVSKLCVFESLLDGRCYVPSVLALLDVWTSIYESSSMTSIRLDQTFTPGRLINLLDDENDQAIAAAMLNPGKLLDSLELYDDGSADLREPNLGTEKLKPKEFTLFIAYLLIKKSILCDRPTKESGPGTGAKEVDADTFIEKWSNILPSSFLKHCTTDMLVAAKLATLGEEAAQKQENPTGRTARMLRWTDSLTSSSSSALSISSVTETIRPMTDGNGNLVSKDGSIVTATAAAAAQNAKATTATTAGTGKRKWHEKFGAQRNAKK